MNLAFTMLLVFEVVELVFSMARSVATSVGKQFEILSLILLRASFKEFTYFELPIDWQHINEPLTHIISDATAALLIFLLLGPVPAAAGAPADHPGRDRSRTFRRGQEGAGPVRAGSLRGGRRLRAVPVWLATAQAAPFFETFYAVLIFADFLLVFISLRYSASYDILFRNSGFALATVVIRIALSAPPFWSAALGVCAMVFTLGVAFSYNLHTGARLRKASP